MKTKKIVTAIVFINILTIFITACSSTKNATTSVSSAPASTSTNAPAKASKPSDGIYPPGEEELAAIQMLYKDVTLEKLKAGHVIYTEGSCTNCHGPKNIYGYAESEWKNIMDDMAQRAMISEAQKDAVYKYVLAIKAAKK